MFVVTESGKDMTKEQGLHCVCDIVAQCLALERDEVTPDASLFTDLGADSLDFLDLTFSLESRFGLRFRDSEFDFVARLDLSSPEVVRDGFLTNQTIERLRPILPALNEIKDPDRVPPNQLFSMITVRTLWIIVERVLHRAQR